MEFSEWKRCARDQMKTNILIVDRDNNTLDKLGQVLSSDNVFVHTAASGREAVKLCRSFRIDLAIIDMGLPDILGCDLVPELKEVCPNIRVILSSEDYSLDVEAKARRSGIIYYAQKPFNMDLLRAVVMKGLENLFVRSAAIAEAHQPKISCSIPLPSWMRNRR